MNSHLSLLEAATLIALSKGFNTISRLEEVLNVDKDELINVLERLEGRGLVKREVRGLFIKRTMYRLTEEGYQLLEEAYEKLKEVADKAKLIAAKNPNTQPPDDPALSSFLADFYALAPLLIWLGMLDTAIVSSLITGNMLEDDFDEDVELVEENWDDLGGEVV